MRPRRGAGGDPLRLVDMSAHRSHPQAREIEVTTTVIGFACAACGEAFPLGGACVQPDGSLRRWRCHRDSPDWTPGGGYRWCPRCRAARPVSECQPDSRGQHRPCLDCVAAEREAKRAAKVAPRTRRPPTGAEPNSCRPESTPVSAAAGAELQPTVQRTRHRDEVDCVTRTGHRAETVRTEPFHAASRQTGAGSKQ